MDGDLAAVLAIERATDGELAVHALQRRSRRRPDARPSWPRRRSRSPTGSTASASSRPTRRACSRRRSSPSSWPDPDQAGPGPDAAQTGTDYLLGFGLTILIFMLIVLYGNWIAMSVVEEKSSRVMEVILNAATPFQLLTGKVLGVGAVALTQYAALLAAGVVALLAQGPVGERGARRGRRGRTLPAGLTIGMLLLLGVFGVLGLPALRRAVRRRRIARQPPGGRAGGGHAARARLDRRRTSSRSTARRVCSTSATAGWRSSPSSRSSARS